MDAICLDEWELLPDHKSSFMEECGNDHGDVGGKDQLLLGAKLVMVDMDHFAAASQDEEAKKPLLQVQTSLDVQGNVLVTKFKDIDVVHMEPKREEAMSKVTEILISDAEEEEHEVIKFPDGVKKVDQDEVLVEAAAPGQQFAGEDESAFKNIGFRVGNLRVHGVGALCSFGVAAATFCIFLLGGKQQHNRPNHKIQLQMYADDQRVQQVVQQASRLNQTMSSVMGGSSSPRASISFGAYYHGF